MAHDEHKAKAEAAIRCAVVTASDTRDESSDESGKLIQELLRGAGHAIASYAILKDEPDRIAAHVRELIAGHEVQAVIVNGGTGVSERDSTFEAIDALLEKRLPGFGELFRMLSYQEIGSSAMLSRATCGVVRGRVVFSVPGSRAAVALAMNKLILPEIKHLVWVAKPSAKHGEKHGHR